MNSLLALKKRKDPELPKPETIFDNKPVVETEEPVVKNIMQTTIID